MRLAPWIALASLAALPLGAQPAPGPGPRPRAPQVAPGRGLGLTEAQRTTIRDLREKQRPEMIRLHEAARKARLDLMEALRKPESTAAALRPLYDKAAAARFEMMMAQRGLQQAVAGVLTPEQRTQAQHLRQGWGAGRMQGPGRGRMEGPMGPGGGCMDGPMGPGGWGPGRPGLDR